MTTQRKRPFTGRHLAIIMVAGFGIVVAVNFTMASFATNGFHGVVVENSYVASQDFNDWLEEAERAKALGWQATAARDADGHVVVTTADIPDRARITAELRRPLGRREYASLDFTQVADATYRSTAPVTDGRWTIRLFAQTTRQRWAEESELP